MKVSRIPCAVCYVELAQWLVDNGYNTHPKCDPWETPNLVAPQGVTGETPRARASRIEAARKPLATDPGPDRTTRLSERNG